MRSIVLISFCLLATSACIHRSSEPTADIGLAEEVFTDFESVPSVSKVAENTLQLTAPAKKIVKDGRMGLDVKDLELAKKHIDGLVASHEAYYSSENLTNNDYASIYNLIIRIPANEFDSFLNGVEAIDGEIDYKNLNSRDVTEEYIDLETRLKNKHSYLERYRELLAQAANVKEILEIEEKIRVIEEEMESTEGRLRYLKDQVDYSTLDLVIQQKIPWKYRAKVRPGFVERLKKSLSGGWYGFVDFGLGMISLWPLWLIMSGLWFVWKKIKEGRRRKMERN